MTGLTGEAGATLRLNFGRPLLLQFRGPAITADTGLPTLYDLIQQHRIGLDM